MKFEYGSTTTLGLIAGATLFLSTAPAAYAATAAQAHQPGSARAISTGQCTTSAANYSVSTDLQTTASKTFSNVTGTAVSFNQGATGCVEVTFSAEAATNPSEILVAQAVIDGTTVCTPGDNLFASDSPSDDLADHTMTYICAGVAAGAHNLRIQFKSRFGSKVALDYRTTLVRYTP